MSRKNSLFLSLLAILVAGVSFIYSGLLHAAEPDQAPSASYTWPYNQGSNISFEQADIKSAWEVWKGRNIQKSNNGTLRVMSSQAGDSTTETVSEGMAYGMLFASLFDEQGTFDDLWRFTAAHLNNNGLMAWTVGNYGTILNRGAATDADEDMAIALINACVKVKANAWPASSEGIDYCLEAEKIIDAIWRFEVDKPDRPGLETWDEQGQYGEEQGVIGAQGYELLAGDGWYTGANYKTDGFMTISYFAPSYYEVYQDFMNNSTYTGNNGFTPVGTHKKWGEVITRQYQISDLIQSQPDNCSNLVPDWHDYKGVSRNTNDNSKLTPDEWSFDAARFAWRVGLDKIWYNRAEAKETSNELGSFFASVGMDNVGRHKMNGKFVGDANNPFFIANAAAAIYAASSLTPINCGAANGKIAEGENSQKAYAKVLGNESGDYYKDAWRLMTMLLMTGNFPNFYQVGVTTPNPDPDPDTDSEVSSCGVEYVIDQTWSNGYNAVITVTNGGTQPIDGYKLEWTYKNQQRIIGSWNADQATQDGTDVTVKTFPSHPWNGTIAAGGNVKFGVSVNASSKVIPRSFTLNGITCNQDGAPPEPEQPEQPETTGDCSVAYAIGDSWSNGYNATVTVSNAGSQPIKGFKLEWTFNDGQTVNDSWNVDYVTQNRNQVTAGTDANSQINGWNGTIAAGGNVAFGVSVNASSQVAPSNFILNGAACTQGNSPSTSPQPLQPKTSSCAVIYDVLSQWDSGFTAAVKITNSGSQIDDWKLAWTYAGDQKISTLWGATHTESGSNMTVSAPSSWGSILEDQTVEFSFNGSFNGENPAPNTFTLSSSNAADQVCESVSTAALSTLPPAISNPPITIDQQPNSTQDNTSYIYVPVISR